MSEMTPVLTACVPVSQNSKDGTCYVNVRKVRPKRLRHIVDVAAVLTMREGAMK